MTPFCGIRKLIQLTLPHCTAPQHVGESGNDTGTRKCYKDSSHHTKHNCIQRISQGQSNIFLVLQHLFLSLSRSLNCLPCHSWKPFPRKIIPLLFLLGRTSQQSPILSKDRFVSSLLPREGPTPSAAAIVPAESPKVTTEFLVQHKGL